jgi:hypothetical protein
VYDGSSSYDLELLVKQQQNTVDPSLVSEYILTDADFNRDKYVPGGIGLSALYNDLKEMSGIE